MEHDDELLDEHEHRSTVYCWCCNSLKVGASVINSIISIINIYIYEMKTVLPTFRNDDPQVVHLKQSACRDLSLIRTKTPLKIYIQRNSKHQKDDITFGWPSTFLNAVISKVNYTTRRPHSAQIFSWLFVCSEDSLGGTGFGASTWRRLANLAAGSAQQIKINRLI